MASGRVAAAGIFSRRRALLATAGALLLPAVLLATPGRASDDCFRSLAETRGYTLGMPRHAVVEPDGKHVLFLRSGARDTRQRLFEFDLGSHQLRELAKPADAPEQLSQEEKARRERARMTLTGITDFALSEDGHTLLATQGETLLTISLPEGKAVPVPVQGLIAPRLSPDGKKVAAVVANNLHVIDLASGKDTALTTGGTDAVTNGLAEFAAAEELERADGAWWSPDSQSLVYEQADQRAVEQHYIADPGHPDRKPAEFRYPRAGTANARVKLGLVPASGGATTWIGWDDKAFPYVARVIWPKQGKLTLVVLNREQTEERLLAVDPASGKTTPLYSVTDRSWLNLSPMYAPRFAGQEMPYWLPDGSGFLFAEERENLWQLDLHHADGTLDHHVTQLGFRYDALNDFDPAQGGSVVVTGSPDRVSFGLYRIGLQSTPPVAIAAEPGLHNGIFSSDSHDLFADSFSLANGETGVALRRADGTTAALLPSVADTPPSQPNVEYTLSGTGRFDTQIVRPHDFARGHKYPVVLSVYAGPGVKNVVRAPRGALEDQCLADHGFIVVTLDGRGTPGRDHDFERAIKGDLIDAPLADQVDGLQSLGERYPEMDIQHVGVEGWSFGGYFSAMATIRRPDVFSAGVAGAPVVDFDDYDTAYTERYLGLPQQAPEAYRLSNVLSYADQLQQPLFLIHGLTDDNVYFENTFKLTQALLQDGKPYNLMLLPGTHQLPDPVLRARVDEARAAFLLQHLQH